MIPLFFAMTRSRIAAEFMQAARLGDCAYSNAAQCMYWRE
jgi:hypothetical protein